jgi:hypothetical protein
VYFLDRDSKNFQILLDYARDGEYEKGEEELARPHAKFFLMEPEILEKVPTVDVHFVNDNSGKLPDNQKSLVEQLNIANMTIFDLYRTIPKRKAELEKRAKEWTEVCERVECLYKQAQNRISLDVGGKVFETTKETLLQKKGTYFQGLSSGNWKPDHHGNCRFKF